MVAMLCTLLVCVTLHTTSCVQCYMSDSDMVSCLCPNASYQVFGVAIVFFMHVPLYYMYLKYHAPALSLISKPSFHIIA